jgi:endonuclease/exonuclease/phosphatase family metal-dependent hydrolase
MPVSRREFCALAGAAVILPRWQDAVGNTAEDRIQRAAPDTMLRVIAYNVFAGTGWPANRPLAQKAVARGQMATRLASELALYEPDIISFSESPDETVVGKIAELLQMQHVRFPGGGQWPGTLFSRLPIVDSENVPLQGERPPELFTRHWGRATVTLPDGDPLIVHSAHLFPTRDSTRRLQEIRVMLQSMKADLQAERSMLLIGDLNHGPDGEEYQLWKAAGWVDTFAAAGQGRGLTIRSDIPRWRVDYVMASGPLAGQVKESRPLFAGAFRLNIEDRESFALSDHLPQLAVFRLGQ